MRVQRFVSSPMLRKKKSNFRIASEIEKKIKIVFIIYVGTGTYTTYTTDATKKKRRREEEKKNVKYDSVFKCINLKTYFDKGNITFKLKHIYEKRTGNYI